MSRLVALLVASLLPVLAALILFGALKAWATNCDALSTPIGIYTPDWDRPLIRQR